MLMVAVPSRFVDFIELRSALNGLLQVVQDIVGHLDALCNEVFGETLEI